jgi:FK506-binding protein 4/5
VAGTAKASGLGAALPGFAGKRELQFTAGDGEVCEAIEHAVLQMLKEERAQVTCSKPALCADTWLPLESLAGVEGKITLTVELLDFDNGKPSWDMSDEEKLAFAAARKEVGTKLFKAQRYSLALERYKKVVEYLRSYVRGDVGEGAEVVKACLLNKAACQLKVEDLTGAKHSCTEVLREEPCNVKALFRRASAYLALYDYSEAEVDLRKLLEVDPSNKEAQRMLPQAVRGAKQQDKKASSMFNMNKAFTGLADDEERRIKEKKEAKEADIAKKSAEAKAEAKKWRETRGKTKSAEETKEDMMRASQQMAQMQRKCMEMSMGNMGLMKNEDDD